MIHVQEFFPDYYPELNQIVEEYINHVLTEIVSYILDYYAESKNNWPDDPYDMIKQLSPKALFREKPELCERRLFELYDLLESPIVRKTIQPIYEYMLYQSIEFVIEIEGNDAEGFWKLGEQERESIRHYFEVEITEDDNYDKMIKDITNLEEFLTVCFWDWDFLPNQVNILTSLSIENPSEFLLFMDYEELDDYIELMDVDLKEKYLQNREKIKSLDKEDKSTFSLLNKDFLKALISVQKNHLYIGKTEDEINDYIRDMLQIKWDVHDQTRQGESETGKQAGEVDFVFMNKGMPFALAEALKTDSMNEAYIHKHITKAIDNYNPSGYPFVFLVMYVTTKDFIAFWSKCFSYLQAYDYHYDVSSEIAEYELPYTEIRQARTIIIRNGKFVTIQFYAVHMKG